MPKMENRIYQTMMALIKQHSPWINATGIDFTLAYSTIENGNQYSSFVKCMTLEARRSVGNYRKGFRWKIPLHTISHSIRNLSETDDSFRKRVQQNEITKYDVEKIILESSYGIIHLYLYNYGVFSTYGSFSGTI